MKKLLFVALAAIVSFSALGQSPQADFRYWERVYKESKDLNVNFMGKGKTLAKWGANFDLDTAEEEISTTGGTPTYSTSNDITHFSSSSAADTQIIRIEGQTVDGSGNFTFVVQQDTVVGQTKTALVTPLARVTRLQNLGSVGFAGTLYVYRDVSVTAGVPVSDIQMTIAVGDNQSKKCATTISQSDVWVITKVSFALKSGSPSGTNVDFEVQVREKGGVFLEKYSTTVSDASSNYTEPLPVPIFVKPNSDVRVIGVSDTNNATVTARLAGYLGRVVQ